MDCNELSTLHEFRVARIDGDGRPEESYAQTERSDYRTPASISRLLCNRSCPHAASMS
jgi:hypothetical protein